MSDPRTHEVHGDDGMPAEFIDVPGNVPGDGEIPDDEHEDDDGDDS
jgi:hypothetical protein